MCVRDQKGGKGYFQSRNLINKQKIYTLSRNLPGLFWWSCLRYGPTPDPGQIDWFDTSIPPPSLPPSLRLPPSIKLSSCRGVCTRRAARLCARPRAVRRWEATTACSRLMTIACGHCRTRSAFFSNLVRFGLVLVGFPLFPTLR